MARLGKYCIYGHILSGYGSFLQQFAHKGIVTRFPMVAGLILSVNYF